MTTPAPNAQSDPVRAAIDSTIMLVLARFFMPMVVAVLGWFMTTILADLKQTNLMMQAQLAHLGEQQASAEAVSATVAARLDAAVKQLDRLQTQVDNLPRKN